MRIEFEEGTTNFFCKIFFAEQFDALRRNCGCDAQFIESLARCIKWESSGGRSKVDFLKTRGAPLSFRLMARRLMSCAIDDRFIVKEISRLEMDALLRFAPAYFDYMSKVVSLPYSSLPHTIDAVPQLPTILAKIYGFYRIGLRNPATGKLMRLDILVMEVRLHSTISVARQLTTRSTESVLRARIDASFRLERIDSKSTRSAFESTSRSTHGRESCREYAPRSSSRSLAHARTRSLVQKSALRSRGLQAIHEGCCVQRYVVPVESKCDGLLSRRWSGFCKAGIGRWHRRFVTLPHVQTALSLTRLDRFHSDVHVGQEAGELCQRFCIPRRSVSFPSFPGHIVLTRCRRWFVEARWANDRHSEAILETIPRRDGWLLSSRAFLLSLRTALD